VRRLPIIHTQPLRQRFCEYAAGVCESIDARREGEERRRQEARQEQEEELLHALLHRCALNCCV
jgi:hypothetical protein